MEVESSIWVGDNRQVYVAVINIYTNTNSSDHHTVAAAAYS